MARGLWEPPEEIAARLQAELEIEQAQSLGFEEYSKRWLEMIRTEPNRSGKKRAVGTVRSYQGKVTGYLVPEFGSTPVREIDAARIKVMTDRLDQIPAPLNPNSKFNGITRPVLIVLMMILRQAARDGIIPAAPNVSVPRQESVRHDADHDAGEDVANPIQVEALYEAVPDQWAIAVLLAAWCQLRRGECLGLQRRDIEWHDDGSATLHVRRKLNANTGGYTDLKSEAGRRSLSIPKLMIGRLQQHLEDYISSDAKAPVLPADRRGSIPLSNINSVAAIVLSLFVFFVGPSLLILNMIPAIAFEFINDLPQMMGRSGVQGEATEQFLASWTIFYWAWWISWSPFVGMFIAKISRGRTIRQFVTVVILVPSLISLVWFAIYGSTAIDQQMNGANLPTIPPEDVLFGVLGNLPFTGITNILLMLLIAIFFITGADSASLVMGTMSQQGRPTPRRRVTITWGTLVGVIAAVLLATGVEGSGLRALQNVTIIAALPFAVILVFIMLALMKDLRRDPLILRDKYGRQALRHSVRTGLAEYGDDFALVPTEYDHSLDTHPWIDEPTDEAFTEVFETASMPITFADAEAALIEPDVAVEQPPKLDDGDERDAKRLI